jgi:hypothetical protein
VLHSLTNFHVTAPHPHLTNFMFQRFVIVPLTHWGKVNLQLYFAISVWSLLRYWTMDVPSHEAAHIVEGADPVPLARKVSLLVPSGGKHRSNIPL